MEFKIGHTATVHFTGEIIDDRGNEVELRCTDTRYRAVPKEFIISVEPPPFTANDGDIVLCIPKLRKPGYYNTIMIWNTTYSEINTEYTYTLLCKKENREDLREQAEKQGN